MFKQRFTILIILLLFKNNIPRYLKLFSVKFNLLVLNRKSYNNIIIGQCLNYEHRPIFKDIF